MTTLFIILIILTSAVLGFFVLIQNPKGGGLASGFSGGANLVGVQRTGDILEKGTWGLSIALMVFCLAINIMGPSGSSSSSNLGNQIDAPVQQLPEQTPGMNFENLPEAGAEGEGVPGAIDTAE
ncbi:MAG TPA: preprotein translocase subunit SecG [Sphingobacterium sp.]|nr:preprotein translocase subunit SecG [Sphingobacterium sp.]